MRRYRISAYDERSGKGLVRHIYVRVNRAGESLCCVVVNGRQLPREPELAAYIQAAGAPYRGRGVEYQYSPGQCDPGREIPHALGAGFSDGYALRPFL